MTPADAIVFPYSLLREQAGSWRLSSQIAAGGRTGAGAFPVVRTDGGGLWLSEMSGVQLHTQDQIRAWRAVEALAEGGVMPLVVPMCDKRHGPFPTVDGVKVYSYDELPHSDDSFFSDGSGYYQNVIDIKAVSSAALRATAIAVQVNVGETPQAGQFFSIEHADEGWRLYLIKSVDDSGAYPILTFSPPLREAVTVGTYLEFDRPRCTMRLQSSDSMSGQMNMRNFMTPSAAFVEYFFGS